MKLIGLMPVRNEAWCLGLTLRVALKWCDEVCLLLHHCTDESLQIVADVQSEVTDRLGYVIADDDSWDEMRHRQWLIECARGQDATHLAIIDADEFITANLVVPPSEIRNAPGRWESKTVIRTEMDRLPRGALLELPGYNLRESTAAPGGAVVRYHLNGVWGNRWFATAFQDSAALHWAGDRFHHREPMGCGWHRVRPIQQGQGGTLHLWGASERRLRAKHALYRITERLRWPNKTAQAIEYDYEPATNPYSLMAQKMGIAVPWTFAQVPPEWIAPYADLMQYLDIDADPWQENEVLTLLMVHGREKFNGLDLLGF
jgi:hypothetical protein